MSVIQPNAYNYFHLYHIISHIQHVIQFMAITHISHLGTHSFAILLGILLSRNIIFCFGQSQNPMKLVFDHHTITNKPHNIQIRLENRMKLVGHYTAPELKITRLGGNLPLVAQFRVLFRSGLLIAQHSFLFLFLFPLFLPFLLLFSSFLIFYFPPFLLSFPPFLFSFPPPSLFPSSSFSLLLPP